MIENLDYVSDITKLGDENVRYSWIDIFTAIGLVLTIIGVCITVGRFLYKRHKRKKKYYKQINKKVSKIEIEDFHEQRPAYKYYNRGIESKISKLIQHKKSFLLVGKPLSGKSRILYESLKSIKDKTLISILKIRVYFYDDFIYPRIFRKKKKTYIVIIDDLHSFVKQNDFEFILRELKRKGFLIISSCRTGIELKNTKNIFIEKMGSFEGFFEDNIIEIEDISEVEARSIVKSNNLLWNDVKERFDGNIGSIFLPLDEMKRRFNKCSREMKLILRDIKKLFYIGAFFEKDIYLISWIEEKSNKKSLKLKKYVFDNLLEELQNLEFLIIREKNIFVDSAYINTVVEYQNELSSMSIIEEMSTAYEDIPKVLFKIGNKIQSIWLLEQNNIRLLKLAKSEYEKAVNKFNPDKDELDIGKTLSNLAGVYSKIGVKTQNVALIKTSLDKYDLTINVFTLQKYPLYFYRTVFNKANTFIDLFNISKDVSNIENALELFTFILNNIQKTKMPLLYAQSLQQIGNLHISKAKLVSDVESKKTLLLDAKQYSEDALQIFNKEIHHFFYFYTLFSLGKVHHDLAIYDTKNINCDEALKFYEHSLEFFTEEDFPEIFKAAKISLEKLSDICSS